MTRTVDSMTPSTGSLASGGDANATQACYSYRTQSTLDQMHTTWMRLHVDEYMNSNKVETHNTPSSPLATASQLGSRRGAAAHAAPPVFPSLALRHQLRGQLLRPHALHAGSRCTAGMARMPGQRTVGAAPVDGDAAAARVPHQHQHHAGVWVLQCMGTRVFGFGSSTSR